MVTSSSSKRIHTEIQMHPLSKNAFFGIASYSDPLDMFKRIMGIKLFRGHAIQTGNFWKSLFSWHFKIALKDYSTETVKTEKEWREFYIRHLKVYLNFSRLRIPKSTHRNFIIPAESRLFQNLLNGDLIHFPNTVAIPFTNGFHMFDRKTALHRQFLQCDTFDIATSKLTTDESEIYKLEEHSIKDFPEPIKDVHFSSIRKMGDFFLARANKVLYKFKGGSQEYDSYPYEPQQSVIVKLTKSKSFVLIKCTENKSPEGVKSTITYKHDQIETTSEIEERIFKVTTTSEDIYVLSSSMAPTRGNLTLRTYDFATGVLKNKTTTKEEFSLDSRMDIIVLDRLFLLNIARYLYVFDRNFKLIGELMRTNNPLSYYRGSVFFPRSCTDRVIVEHNFGKEIGSI